MKRLFSGLVLASLIVSGVWAASAEGEITKLVVLQSGDIEVTIGSTAGKKIRNANTSKKEMYAMLLTAQSAHSTIKITHEDGIIKTTAILTPAP